MKKKLAIFGEYDPGKETHLATDAAIEHSRIQLGVELEALWIPTDEITEEILSHVDGMWITPGSPYKNKNNALKAIRYAREKKVPCFGTCGGFQHIMIEFAENLLGIKEAGHEEYDPAAETLFISELTCSLKGREMELNLVKGSRVWELYRAEKVTEKYYCNFGIHPDFVEAILEGPISLVGSDSEGIIRVVEYPEHPFFVGTLFVPQARSTAETPHPLVTGFIEAIYKH